MSSEVSWSNIPDDIKRIVIPFLHYKARCNLRKCSKDSRDLVDSVPLHLEKLALVIDTVHVRIHICARDDYPLFLHYHKFQMGCKLKIITRNTLRKKVLDMQDFLRVALQDFKVLTRQRSLSVDFLPITCDGQWGLEQLKTVLDTSEEKIRAKKFRLTFQEDHTEEFRRWIDSEDVEHDLPISLEQIIAQSNAAADNQ